MDRKHVVQVAFLDLSKAFNSLNHEILMQKLVELGLGEQAISIIMSFTAERPQRVKVGNMRSDWIQMNRGVPQGTVLGPMLYLLYVNNVRNARSPQAKLVQFADDPCIFTSAKTHTECEEKLDHELQNITEFFEEHELTLNIEKTTYLYVEIGLGEMTISAITLLKLQLYI